MCKVIEEMRNEVALNKAIEIAKEMLKDGMSVEKVAQYSHLSMEMVEELKRTIIS